MFAPLPAHTHNHITHKPTQVVSLHCNLDDNTRHLINAARLKMMKPDAVLVNAARGPCIDEAALVAHMKANPNFRAGARCYCNGAARGAACWCSSLVKLLPWPGATHGSQTTHTQSLTHNTNTSGLDVFEDEPAMAPGLAELPNAVIVPHIASASMWTRSGMVGGLQMQMQMQLGHAALPVPAVSQLLDVSSKIANVLTRPCPAFRAHRRPSRWPTSRACCRALAPPMQLVTLTACLHPPPTPCCLCTQATLAAANVAGVLQGFGAWSNPNDITPFLDGPMASLPRAAPSIVNAKDIGLATA